MEVQLLHLQCKTDLPLITTWHLDCLCERQQFVQYSHCHTWQSPCLPQFLSRDFWANMIICISWYSSLNPTYRNWLQTNLLACLIAMRISTVWHHVLLFFMMTICYISSYDTPIHTYVCHCLHCSVVHKLGISHVSILLGADSMIWSEAWTSIPENPDQRWHVDLRSA